MVVFNYSGREINAKIVYYGPGLSGKTTNLERIYGQVPESRRGKMVSMKTRSDRTLFFDFLPVQGGEIKGFRTRYLLYTVPGQVHYNATRKLVLKGTDAIIFVADSDPALREANKESMKNLEENLAEYNLSLDKIPVIIQYNKRDVPNPLSIEELNADLNPRGWPWFEGVAVEDKGVWETFRAAVDALFKTLEANLGGDGGGEKTKESDSASEKENPAAGKQADIDLVPPVTGAAAVPSGGVAVVGSLDDGTAGGQTPSAAQPAYDVDASIRGNDGVVQLSNSDEILGGVRARHHRPAVPNDPSRHNQVDLPVVGSSQAAPGVPSSGSRKMGTGIDWQHDYVPPGSRRKDDGPSIGEAVPPAGAAGGEPSRPASPPAVTPTPASVPPASAPPPAPGPTAAPVVVNATALDGGVIRVPVELRGGEGTVRIEIALTLQVSEKTAPATAPVDTAPPWK